MLQATEFLRLMRFITKSHEACIQTICREHQLTMMEATIITFLRNNPSVDTAADIADAVQGAGFPGSGVTGSERTGDKTAGCFRPAPDPSPVM